MKHCLRWTDEDKDALVRLLWRIGWRYEIEEVLTRHYGCARDAWEWTNPQLDGRYRLSYLDDMLVSVLFIDEASK